MGVNALRESMGVDRAEAQEFYDTYKATFVTLMNYLEKVKTRSNKIRLHNNVLVGHAIYHYCARTYHLCGAQGGTYSD